LDTFCRNRTAGRAQQKSDKNNFKWYGCYHIGLRAKVKCKKSCCVIDETVSEQ
jgi:hypothetical protein